MEWERKKTAAVPSTSPKRAKKGYSNNSKDELRFPLGVRVVEGWSVRAACRVGDGRVVELFTALQIDIAVSEPFAEFLMKTYVADERRVSFHYIYTSAR